jgi:hypothetical protein
MSRKKQIRVTLPMAKRMRQLREANLSVEAVARVIELDFGAKPSESTVHTYAPMGRGKLQRVGGLAGMAHTNSGQRF